MANEHYFSQSPSSDEGAVERRVSLQGREYAVTTSGGVFSASHVDKGTAVLLRKAPEPDLRPGDLAIDLGCGWCPLTLALCEKAASADVWAVDVNERALELTRKNAARSGFSPKALAPDEALAALGDRKIQLIWSNPPVRIGKERLHELLATWIEKLSDDGAAYLVIQRNLGADSLRSWMLGQGWGCEKIGSAKGFRVFAVTRTPRDGKEPAADERG
mgnify:FL=1